MQNSTPLIKKMDEYSPNTKTSKTPTQTSILIKPQYGSVFTKESLTEELTTFVNYFWQSNLADQPSQLSIHTPTINTTHILLQFENSENTLKLKQLFDQNKDKFLKETYTDAIL